jgi:hypothetical protein
MAYIPSATTGSEEPPNCPFVLESLLSQYVRHAKRGKGRSMWINVNVFLGALRPHEISDRFSVSKGPFESLECCLNSEREDRWQAAKLSILNDFKVCLSETITQQYYRAHLQCTHEYNNLYYVHKVGSGGPFPCAW